LLCFTFAFVGLAFMVLTVILSTEEK